MAKYQPKQFAPHIYPEWGELISDLPPEKAAEIFMAICQYPNLNPDIGIWRFIKSQIDKDYQDFIDRNQAHKDAIKNYWNNKKEQKETNENNCSPLLNKSEQEYNKEEQTDNKGELKHKTNNINININNTPPIIPPKEKKHKISFDEVDDWESLFTYWEENKKGGKYKNQESRQRMLEKLKKLTENDFDYAKQAICHCLDSGYQGFCNGNELFYKGAKPQWKTIDSKPDAFEIFNQAMDEIERRAAQ